METTSHIPAEIAKNGDTHMITSTNSTHPKVPKTDHLIESGMQPYHDVHSDDVLDNGQIRPTCTDETLDGLKGSTNSQDLAVVSSHLDQSLTGQIRTPYTDETLDDLMGSTDSKDPAVVSSHLDQSLTVPKTDNTSKLGMLHKLDLSADNSPVASNNVSHEVTDYDYLTEDMLSDESCETCSQCSAEPCDVEGSDDEVTEESVDSSDHEDDDEFVCMETDEDPKTEDSTESGMLHDQDMCSDNASVALTCESHEITENDYLTEDMLSDDSTEMNSECSGDVICVEDDLDGEVAEESGDCSDVFDEGEFISLQTNEGQIPHTSSDKNLNDSKGGTISEDPAMPSSHLEQTGSVSRAMPISKQGSRETPKAVLRVLAEEKNSRKRPRDEILDVRPGQWLGVKENGDMFPAMFVQVVGNKLQLIKLAPKKSGFVWGSVDEVDSWQISRLVKTPKLDTQIGSKSNPKLSVMYFDKDAFSENEQK